MISDRQAHAGDVYILATLDTKGREAAYVRDLLVDLGVRARLVDVGCLGAPSVIADVDREQFFAVAGFDVARLSADADRG